MTVKKTRGEIRFVEFPCGNNSGEIDWYVGIKRIGGGQVLTFSSAPVAIFSPLQSAFCATPVLHLNNFWLNLFVFCRVRCRALQVFGAFLTEPLYTIFTLHSFISNMSFAPNSEAARVQSSKVHEPIPERDSSTKSLSWLEYKSSLEAAETNFDIATTHKNNEELNESSAVKKFFEQVKDVGFGMDNKSRKWLGSLPSKMSERAIPLFTDEAGIDFQLHFSYTWMGAFHTAGTKNVEGVDPYAHSLIHIANSDDLELISNPNIVVPLGKLFVNKDSYSTWTGYEVFVCSNLHVWIIYTLDEVDPEDLYPEEVRLSRWDIPGIYKDGQIQAEKSPGFKIARLWDWISTIGSATFEKAEEEVRKSHSKDYVGSIHLLELSRTVVSSALSGSDEIKYKHFATSKLKVTAESKAGRQLLALAIENAKIPILELLFEDRWRQYHNQYQDLISLATEYDDENIFNLMLESDQVSPDLRDTLLSFATADAANKTVKRAIKNSNSSIEKLVKLLEKHGNRQIHGVPKRSPSG